MWTFYHITTFLLTFISYAFFHATRKTFSNVKSTISDEWRGTEGNVTEIAEPKKIWDSHHMFDTSQEAETYLGVLDAVFMVSYAVGLYISGILGDRFDMRKVLAFGMCSSAITVFLFGSVLEWSHYYNKYLYVAVWICNGLLQSTGWPTVVAIMGNWFGRSSRGLVLGLWSACASVGNIIGALMVSQVLHYGYDFAFLVTSTVLFAGGIINFFGLVTSPKELGLPVPDELHEPEVEVYVEEDEQAGDIQQRQAGTSIEEDDIRYREYTEDTEPLLPGDKTHVLNRSTSSSRSEETENRSENALSFWRALLLPGVILYALAYFCLKLVNYSFFFWLPFYLHASFKWPESMADKISIWYDIGGIIGGTIAGLISDCFNRRSIVVVPMLVIAIPVLFGYSPNSPKGAFRIANSVNLFRISLVRVYTACIGLSVPILKISAVVTFSKDSPNDMTTNAVLMTITGYFIGGVANLVSAAISADLGRQGPVQGNKEALATVTGIVDGTGSVGAALGQILVPILQENLGWHAAFYLFMIMTFLTILCILPLFLREVPLFLKDLRAFCRKYKYTWYRGIHLKSSSVMRSSINGETNSDAEESALLQD